MAESKIVIANEAVAMVADILRLRDRSTPVSRYDILRISHGTLSIRQIEQAIRALRMGEPPAPIAHDGRGYFWAKDGKELDWAIAFQRSQIRAMFATHRKLIRARASLILAPSVQGKVFSNGSLTMPSKSVE